VCSCFQLNLLCVKSAHVCVLDFAAYSFRSLPLVYFTADFPLDFGPQSPRAGVSSPALSSWLRLQFWFREGSSARDGLWSTSSLKIALESGLDLCHRSLTLFFRFLIPGVFCCCSLRSQASGGKSSVAAVLPSASRFSLLFAL
jgi:hypothetical protein